MNCGLDEVDDNIRQDFEDMPSHLFQDRYKDILTKYVSSLSELKSNSALALISGVRSFFTNECVSIKFQNNALPRREMAMNEHRFTLSEFQKMWLLANTEGKARLSLAVSLGWSIGEFISLKSKFVREILNNFDGDGYVSFDYRRKKSQARIRGVLNPSAVKDLRNYLKRVPHDQEYLWTTKTEVGINYWFKTLFEEVGIQRNETVRFHLIRKYVIDALSPNIGVYETKLLVGKKIPLADETYLHGLEDRLLERYKKFAYPFLKLDEREPYPKNELAMLKEEVEFLREKYDAMRRDFGEKFKEEILGEIDRRIEKLLREQEYTIVDSKDIEGVDLGKMGYKILEDEDED